MTDKEQISKIEDIIAGVLIGSIKSSDAAIKIQKLVKESDSLPCVKLSLPTVLEGIQFGKQYPLPDNWKNEDENSNYMGGFLSGVRWREFKAKGSELTPVIFAKKNNNITEEIKKEMFKRHTHAELLDEEEIVYTEKDVLDLLELMIKLKG